MQLTYVRVAARLCSLCVCLCVMACGADGTEAYAGWNTFESIPTAFRFRYLEPPWELQEIGTRSARAVVHASLTTTVDGGPPEIYILEADVRTGMPEAMARADVTAAPGLSQRVVVPMGPFATRSGVRGFDVVTESTSGPLLHYRYVSLEHPLGVLRVEFESTVTVNSPEMNALLASFEVVP